MNRLARVRRARDSRPVRIVTVLFVLPRRAEGLSRPEAGTGRPVTLRWVVVLLVVAALVGGAVGASATLVLDRGKVGPRGPTGAKGPPGPPGIYADVGVLEARIAALDRRLTRLERRAP